MTPPRRRWDNCLFFLCYALLRGRVDRVTALTARGGWFPWHLVAITPRGHAIHFRAALEHKHNRLAPVWFLGRVEGVRRRSLDRALRMSGRSYCWCVRSPALLYGGLLLIAPLVLLPWAVLWTVWPMAWVGKSVADALYKRVRKTRTLWGGWLALETEERLAEPNNNHAAARPQPSVLNA